MTKDTYFEMCELMGTEPKEDEIPVELEDLYDEVQEAYIVYNMLQDNWDSMNGIYLGKNFIGVYEIMDMMEVDDSKTCFNILHIFDKHRRTIINEKNKKPAS